LLLLRAIHKLSWGLVLLIFTMSLKWIARRLHMGSWTYVSNLLNEAAQALGQAQEVPFLCQ